VFANQSFALSEFETCFQGITRGFSARRFENHLVGGAALRAAWGGFLPPRPVPFGETEKRKISQQVRPTGLEVAEASGKLQQVGHLVALKLRCGYTAFATLVTMTCDIRHCHPVHKD
jgi:hypothetical protein